MAKRYEANEFTKCPIIYAMEKIGSKWKIPILWNLSRREELHYNELKRRVTGITNTMLTRALRELEEDGIIIRISDGTVPPSVTYKLSDAGRKLMPALDSLFAWGEENQNTKKGPESP